MLIRATIDFEVEDELVNISSNRLNTDEAWEAKLNARNEIMKSLYVNFGKCSSSINYEQIMKETNIKDFKFRILKDNPLIFEL